MFVEIDLNKCDKLCGFFVGAQRMGYSLGDAWKLLQISKEGQGILNNEYDYCIHHQGITSSQRADKVYGNKFKKGEPFEPDIVQMELLAEFIEMAHLRYGLPYATMFKKCGIDEFMATCGVVLGNYDDKLVKAYLI